MEERRAVDTDRTTYRTVRPGDTLYNIAWEQDIDYRKLAEWNRIDAPYLIRPGQRLRLRPGPPTTPRASSSRATGKPAPGTARGNKPRTSPSKAPGAAAPASWPRTVRWTWPSSGRIQRRFSKRAGNKGVDIAGRRGQTVKAAADGKVVYKGGGLRGYGQLIILKHNETFLSAYAHNDKVYVSEGDWVRRGHRIAEMGSSGTDRVKLHFEIRRQGVPVNPLRYLPKR